MIELSRYVSETLREDEGLAFYRGRRDDGELPAILSLAPVSEHPDPAILERLEHEYSLRDELDSDWAARPLALALREVRPILILEAPAGEPLDRLLGQPMELSRFLRIAVGLAAALGKLHQQGLIHKDIKPANVLVDSASGAVWLTGFGIASRLPRERQSAEPPEVIAGTLAYMAPEQTGQMNRSIDSRSDLYSLGVTFYQMLTGFLPFTASDPTEWVHCHLARKPEPPSGRVEGVPRAVSGVVMKLLAKTAEERYQTAAGLEAGLRRLLDEYLRSLGVTGVQGEIPEFQLRQYDTPDRLCLSAKLFWPQREIASLHGAFDRVAAGGGPELVLVAGQPGIGKSVLVHELYHALPPKCGLFASGKFDQYKRDIPYASLAQAMVNLIRVLLAKHDAALVSWRTALPAALCLNGEP